MAVSKWVRGGLESLNALLFAVRNKRSTPSMRQATLHPCPAVWALRKY